MKAGVTECGRFIQINEASELELEQMHLSFNKRIESWRWHPLVKRGHWDGYIKFIDNTNRIPIGLWHRLTEECKKHNIELELSGTEYLINKEFNKDEFEDWVWEFFKNTRYGKGGDRELRGYQITAAADTIKYYKSRSELATSAGKTIIAFIVLAYLMHKGWAKKHLIIVPNISLVIQTAEDFVDEYSIGTELEGKLTTQLIGGGRSTDKKDVDVIIGTYQTLKTLSDDFYSDIECVFVDECHTTQAKSIKDIIVKSYDSKYRYGLSGTMSTGDSADSMTLDAYLGPIVNKVSAKFLIANEFATPIYVKSIVLDYMDEENKSKLYELRQRRGTEIDGAKILELERKLVIENRPRFRYICDIIGRTTKNALVLFLDVKHEYGKDIYHYIRDNHNDKVAYYVDGSTASDIREEYKAGMEEGNNKILVASFGTFATGISINNIHHIFFVESYKSDRLVRQSIGRGMRLKDGKDKVYLWDFVDDFRYGTDNRYKNNYLYRHGDARIKTYKEQGFPHKRYRVKL